MRWGAGLSTLCCADNLVAIEARLLMTAPRPLKSSLPTSLRDSPAVVAHKAHETIAQYETIQGDDATL